MTTAHRPTFDPARGKDSLSGPTYHQRLQPAHTTLKHRQAGQGTDKETQARDLRAELLQAEAAYFASKNKKPTSGDEREGEDKSVELALITSHKRISEGSRDDSNRHGGDEDDDPEVKRRRLVLQKAMEVDADLDSDESSSGSSESESDSDDDDDDEDETIALMRELEKIKQERAEKAAKEEAEKAAQEEESRMKSIARGNPLLNSDLQPRSSDFGVKRRWDDDVVFRNQARGVDERNKGKEFVNDLLRSDFHKRFMNKYVR